jgi:hypothetical protein
MANQFFHPSFTATHAADHCFQCGFEMLHVDMTFALLGNEVAWNVFLPVCLHCNSNSEGQDCLATYTTHVSHLGAGSPHRDFAALRTDHKGCAHLAD